jgi:fatty-acyl-CoA synthase
MRSPEKDKQCLELYEELLPNMADYVEKYAKEKGNELAIIEVDTDEKVTWKTFNKSVNAFAAKLLSIGLKKGDIIATSLPLLKEHVYLMYACYKIGVIIAPLDLRLKTEEIIRSLDKIKPKAYFFLGKTPLVDFRPMIAEAMKAATYVEHWVQFQKEADLIMEGAIGIAEFVKDIKSVFIKSLITGKVKKAKKKVDKRDPALIIFTTGSTGFPKPALICHENILIQNIGLAVGFDLDVKDRMLVNLPPSHVGCTTEQLATTIYGGGVSVIMHIFKPDLSLEAVQKYKVTALGQIPALFSMEWRLPDYDKYDLSTLRFALYGGQAVTRQFLEKLSTMAPQFGTGLGLTETAGFVTYSPLDGTVDDILAGVGFDQPLCPISIREPMKPDGSAGDEKPKGEIGEICFSGKQIFLGYLNDEENTKKTISSDGYCYTGDLGYYDEKGLHFAGRSKHVIKPKGYQVFPAEVEDFIQQKLKDKVGLVACVGTEHDVFTEGIVAFVELKKGATLNTEEVMSVCKDLAAYKRPSHVVLVELDEEGKGIPLNRVAKTDYLILKDMAKKEVEILREQGGWDK